MGEAGSPSNAAWFRDVSTLHVCKTFQDLTPTVAELNKNNPTHEPHALRDSDYVFVQEMS